MCEMDLQGWSRACRRTAWSEQGVEAAVPAYIRHMHTDYDDRLHEEVANSQEKFTVEEIKQSVRSEVRAKIASILAAWETPPSV